MEKIVGFSNRKRLLFICQWGIRKKRSWSGTNYKIFAALQKRFSVRNVTVRTGIETVIRSFCGKKAGCIGLNYNYPDVLKFEKSKACTNINGKVCTFQFLELNLPESVHSYIYQDMCIQYIIDVIKTNPEFSSHYKLCGSDEVLEERKARQEEYYKRCKGVFVMGEWLKEYMVRKMGIPAEKVHCVGAGYDIDTSKIVKAERSGNKILFVGRDFNRKGGDVLLDAFAILKSKYNSNAELYIAGVGEEGRSTDDIHWLGDVCTEELIHYYCGCDVLCVPSYVEPFGKVYIEALCCGMPVVALNRFSTPDFVRDCYNGYLLDECNPLLLAEKLHDILKNDEIKKNATESSEYYQKEYSWDAVADRISNVLDRDEYFSDSF